MDIGHLFLEDARNSRCPGGSWPLEVVEILILIGFCVVLLELYCLQLPFLGRDMLFGFDCFCLFPFVSINSVFSI